MPKFYSPSGNFEVWDEKPDGYYTEDEWAELHPPTPYVPSKEEKLAALDSQYNADKDSLIQAYLSAQLYGDEDLMTTLRADLSALDEKYDSDYESIANEEE